MSELVLKAPVKDKKDAASIFAQHWGGVWLSASTNLPLGYHFYPFRVILPFSINVYLGMWRVSFCPPSFGERMQLFYFLLFTFLESSFFCWYNRVSFFFLSFFLLILILCYPLLLFFTPLLFSYKCCLPYCFHSFFCCCVYKKGLSMMPISAVWRGFIVKEKNM